MVERRRGKRNKGVRDQEEEFIIEGKMDKRKQGRGGRR